jgi:hypothetical protein
MPGSTKNTDNRPSSRELDALAGDDVFCCGFTYRPGTESFGEQEPADICIS